MLSSFHKKHGFSMDTRAFFKILLGRGGGVEGGKGFKVSIKNVVSHRIYFKIFLGGGGGGGKCLRSALCVFGSSTTGKSFFSSVQFN